LVKVKSSQKIFTDTEVASLTGICVEHLHNFARSRHLGMIARAAEAAGAQAEQWLFTLSDLMVLATLPPQRCCSTWKTEHPCEQWCARAMLELWTVMFTES
jgi:hypothetical protein